MSLLEGLEESVLSSVAARLMLNDGVEDLIRHLQSIGCKTAILSGGFDYFGRFLQKKLGFDEVHANSLDIKDGKVTGKAIMPIVNGDRKAQLLKELAKKEMTERIKHSQKLKEKLLGELPNYIDEYIINGHMAETLPNLVSISVKYIEGESVVLMLDDEKIAVSTRSACATGSLRTSHVLQSIGREYADAQGTLIVSFGKDNTEEDVIRFLSALRDVVKTLRDISPLYQKVSQA